MLKELKAFLFRGNVVDLAVAVIIGAAFQGIITSLVTDVITPLCLNPVVKALGVEDIAKLTWNGIAYGNFLAAVINFLIVGTTLFFIVRAADKAMKMASSSKVAEEAAAAPSQEELLVQIRDLLKEK